MTTTARLLFLFSILAISAFAKTDKTPSLNEIANLKNSELDEIFGSTMSKTQPPPDLPDMPEQGSMVGRFNRGPSGPREVPINHRHALGPQGPATSNSNGELENLAAQGANVLATGANAFYRGAASVGQAFGIPSGGYQVPLLSQAASLFG